MDTKQLTAMLQDGHFDVWKKLQYKYSAPAVAEMLDTLKVMGFASLPIHDFGGGSCVYYPAKCIMPKDAMRHLLSRQQDPYGRKAMEDEIEFTLRIENIHSNRDSVRKIVEGYAPSDQSEAQIFGIKKGLDFISDRSNAITEENLHRLYMLSVGDFLGIDDQLLPGQYYRHDAVYITGDKTYHQGISAAKLPQYMAELVVFINRKDEIPELTKACIIHFYFAYLHPYFDGNGRTARLLHLWYLVQQGFSSTLFFAFSKHINQSKNQYYKCFTQIEENFSVGNLLDMTPFIRYFKESVYDQIPRQSQDFTTIDRFLVAKTQGVITEKEQALWHFVLSRYGQEPFSTKQLERDFSNAAYATIRGFVLKFEGLELLRSQRYGNRVKYQVN
ncbi:Fic family protein [Bengtsoniella intestinalis]|uniref:Fic family protein n=1 Tax=Bengtsoniella intestinalis TaxID=3073143 RepID=UPI00391F7844